MIKVRILSDEMYPVYSLEEVEEKYEGKFSEVDEEFYKEYDEIATKFCEMQNRIEKLLKAEKLV